MKTANSIIRKLAVGCVLACCHAVSVQLFAQTGQDTFSGINLSASLVQAGRISLTVEDVPAISSLSDEQLAALVTALDATPTIPASALPRGGMGMACWSLQNPSMPPLPGNTIGVDAWMLSDGSLLLNDVNFDYDSLSAISLATGPQMRRSATANDGISPPGFGDGGGDGGYIPDISTNIPPNYGTNLWIAQTAVAAGYLTGIGSNTLADVQYELQSRTNLALQSDWQSEGFIFGSELTNWTPLSVAQNNRTNLFVRLKSWASSDGSGLPDWWQLQYFGTTGVDPYAFDSANDGWTIYQKFQLGVNPNAFYTPATPQGVTASLHQSSQTATVSWLPSAGSVAGYVVEKTDYYPSFGGYYPPVVQDSPTLSPSVTSYPDNLAGNQVDYFSRAYEVTYKVRAVYSGGSSGWSAEVPVQPATVSGSFVPGTNGETYLEVAGLPANAAIIQLGMWFSETIGGVGISVTNDHNIAASDLATGRYLLPTNWSPAATVAQLPYGFYYGASLKSIDTNGNSSAATGLDGDWGTPFYDGRAQMKQNLIFQLRAASMESALYFFLPRTNGDPALNDALAVYSYPTNYACEGLYQFTDGHSSDGYNTQLDPFLPFKENALFRNFVFNLSDVDTNGNLTTGAGIDIYGTPALNHPATYIFETNGSLPNLLSANESRWLLPSYFDGGLYPIGFYQNILFYYYLDSSGHWPIAMSGSCSNWFGLPYVSAKMAYQATDAGGNPLGLQINMLYPGTALNNVIGGDINLYPEPAQPTFQPVKYCFYRPGYDWLPGSDLFTPTNDSPMLIEKSSANVYYTSNDLPFLIVPAGSWSQIAGYAKLALQNGYPGVYAYLGQYFDKAYKMTNGVVTTTTTGMVSPYGNYFATEVGAAALVTLPDLDPPYQRGTCTVYSVALQVDKNHDGTMDLSFNGPDATSQLSPMVFWINNDQDYSSGIGDAGQDVPTTAYYNDGNIGNISSQRDLEDYARLWICGMPALTNGNFQVSLSWTNVSSGNPTINLFNSVETNGGIGYLTDTNIAVAQIQGNRDFIYGGPGMKIAAITPGRSYTFPASYFTNPGNKYFLFDGAITNGAGELLLTISQNGNPIAQTGTWLDLHDIKELYEQARVTGVNDSAPGAGSFTSSFVEDHILQTNPIEDPKLILFVHGWRMGVWDYQSFSDTMFKRLYWAGYQGRFASLRWPTLSKDDFRLPLLDYTTYNSSELRAWKSGMGLSSYLTHLKQRLPNYSLNVAAHSMGNVVMAEALKDQLALGQKNVDNYVLMQAAVPAHCYQTTLSDYGVFTTAENSKHTPDTYRGYPGSINQALNGQMTDFFNANDYALATGTWGLLGVSWENNQKLFKPDNSLFYSVDNTGTNCFNEIALGVDTPINDSREKMAFCARPRSKAVGALGGVGGVILGNEVDLTESFNFRGASDQHSAQFNWSIQQVKPFYVQLLATFFTQQP